MGWHVLLMPFVSASRIISRYSLSPEALIHEVIVHGQPSASVIIFYFSHLFNLFIHFLWDLIRSLRFIIGFADLISSHSKSDFSPSGMGLISASTAASAHHSLLGPHSLSAGPWQRAKQELCHLGHTPVVFKLSLSWIEVRLFRALIVFNNGLPEWA